MSKLYTYQNGNYQVDIYSDGTKIRSVDSDVQELNPAFPESIDMKITNKCHQDCLFCHESSNEFGDHADSEFVSYILSQLPEGTEIALGGGDVMTHPDIHNLCQNAAVNFGLVPNLTVSDRTLDQHTNLLTEMSYKRFIYGLGVSYTGKGSFTPFLTKNTVLHVIAGLQPISILDEIIEISAEHYTPKVLVLGYKTKGRGKKYFVDHSKKIVNNFEGWSKNIGEYFGQLHLSFDNLAIKQLSMEDRFSENYWAKAYMGDDGDFTMYMDMVNKTFATSSSSSVVYSMKEPYCVREMFSNV